MVVRVVASAAAVAIGLIDFWVWGDGVVGWMSDQSSDAKLNGLKGAASASMSLMLLEKCLVEDGWNLFDEDEGNLETNDGNDDVDVDVGVDVDVDLSENPATDAAFKSIN